MNIIQGCPWPQERHLGGSLCPRGTSGGVLVPIWGIPGPSCGGVPILNEHHLEVSLSPETSFRGVPDPRSITWGVAMSSGSVILGCPHPQGHRLGVSLSHEHHLGVSLYPGGTSGGVHLPIWGVPIPRSVILGCPYTLLGVSLSPGASFEGCPCAQEGHLEVSTQPFRGVPVPRRASSRSAVPIPGLSGCGVMWGRAVGLSSPRAPQELSGFTLDHVAFEDGKGKCPYDPTKGHTGLIVGR